MRDHDPTRKDGHLVVLIIVALAIIVLFMFAVLSAGWGRLVAIGGEQAAIRTVIAGALVEHANENERARDALLAIQQSAAIVKALDLAGYEIRRRT